MHNIWFIVRIVTTVTILLSIDYCKWRGATAATEIEQDWGEHDVLPPKLKLLRSASCLDMATAGNPDSSMRGENAGNKCYVLSP